MSQNYRTVIGVALMLAGLLMVAQQMGLIGGQWDDALLTLGFAAGTLFFASLFFSDRTKWWAALVAFIMLGLAAANFLDVFFPQVSGSLTGTIFLLMMGIGFLAVYFLDRNNWWAIIPGGVMLSLSAVTFADDLLQVSGFDSAGILFLGMGLTFLVLYYLPVNGERMGWPIFPALGLILFGIFIGFEQAELWKIMWPVMIILAGIWFIFGAFRR